MKTEQRKWTSETGWELSLDGQLNESAQLVLAFGGRHELSEAERYNEIRAFYPNARILSGSTSGEIIGNEVHDDSIVCTAVEFEKTKLKYAELNIADVENSTEAGKQLANDLKQDDLRHVFVLSEGLKVNGSELVKGFNEALPRSVSVTGGLVGDAARFEKTVLGIDKAPSEGGVIAIGLYGDNIKIGHGSRGGWDPFGPERRVTKSSSNVLYELDGQSALQLYKEYLGDQAGGLPGTGLLFPLSVKENEESSTVVRTLLAIDEDAQSMTFAGDIPEGSVVQLMKANFERLIDGATDAADITTESIGSGESELAILISCVGRKLVLGQRIEEEVEEVRDVIGDAAVITGFYSYGEISPLNKEANCDLHNQTMTITTLKEV